MPDREKVIKGLEHCMAPVENCCDGCPYLLECLQDIKRLECDALALLKPVAPKHDGLRWLCGACNDIINSFDRFCSNCGKAVKWDADE